MTVEIIQSPVMSARVKRLMRGLDTAIVDRRNLVISALKKEAQQNSDSIDCVITHREAKPDKVEAAWKRGQKIFWEQVKYSAISLLLLPILATCIAFMDDTTFRTILFCGTASIAFMAGIELLVKYLVLQPTEHKLREHMMDAASQAWGIGNFAIYASDYQAGEPNVLTIHYDAIGSVSVKDEKNLVIVSRFGDSKVELLAGPIEARSFDEVVADIRMRLENYRRLLK